MRPFPLLAAAVLLLASLPAPAEDAPLDAALKSFEAGEYAKAAEAAAKVAADDPLYAKSRYLRGESLLALGDPAGAEKEFLAGLERKPESQALQAGLGRALLAEGQHEKALVPLQKAVKSDGKDPVARRALGECLLALQRTAEGRKELEQAVKLDPKDPLAARSLAEFLLRMGEAEAAGRVAEGLAKADPRSAMAPFLRGLALDRQGKSKEAIAAYEDALEKDPRFLDAHKNLAILCIADNPSYTDGERTRKALDHFGKYFELGGKDEELKSTYETIKSFMGGNRGK